MSVSHTELGEITKQAIELAGSQERFDSLLTAKHDEIRPPTGKGNLRPNKTVETLFAATEAVLADLQAAPPIPKPEAIKASAPTIVAKTTDEHFAAYAAITDPKARGEYYEKHLASAFAAKAQSPRNLKEEFAAISDPTERGRFFAEHETEIMKRTI